jgi:hypothetical protein
MPQKTPESTAAATKWLKEALDSDRDYYVEAEVAQLTALTEDCANDLELYEDNHAATIPEWLFELTLEVATRLDLVE